MKTKITTMTILSLILSLPAISPAATAATTAKITGSLPTPEQTSGPFYPGSAAFASAGADLTNELRAKGEEALHLTGEVLDQQLKPIANAEVQIWQTDGDQGRYLVEKTDKPLDPNFKYLGKDLTNKDGQYQFMTVRPKEYLADEDWTRPDHIHVRVLIGGVLRLTTQMYFSDDMELINKDLILKELSPEQRQSVIIDFHTDKYLSEYYNRIVRTGNFKIILK